MSCRYEPGDGSSVCGCAAMAWWPRCRTGRRAWRRCTRRIAGAFARAEPRARVLAYLRGLLGQLEHKNGWTLAEAAGEVSPDGMQRLLRTRGPERRHRARRA